MRREVPSNADMLAWVSDEERQVCRSCGEKACVTVANAAASFCLCCDAITIDGVRIDVDRRIPIDSAVFSGRAGSPLEAV